MAIKNKLKEIRMREYAMDQAEFSKLLEVDIKNYSNWERNVSRPNLEKALIIAEKLNKKVDDIWHLHF